MRMWKIFMVVGTLAIVTATVSAAPLPELVKPKIEILPDVEIWGDRLAEKQLLAIPNRDTDAFKGALDKLAFYTDGPREHVNEILKDVGYPVDVQGKSWNQLSPGTKVALAAKQAYVSSDRDGQLFGALLAKRLAISYPSLKEEPELAPFHSLTIEEAEMPRFTTNRPVADLPPLDEEIAKAVIHLASYVSSAGAVTDADLARLTPLKATEQVEILAAAKNSIEALEGLLKMSHAMYANHYEARDAELLTKQLFAKWTKATAESYPALKKESAFTAWLGPLDPPKPPGEFPGSNEKPGAPGSGENKPYNPTSRSGIPRTVDDGAPGKKPNVGTL